MARLSVSLLGTFAVLLDGELVTAFESDKARALLAYLAVEADRPHRRETLAGLLWPEQDEHRARHSLSQTLFNLRQAIGDPAASPSFLLITPQTLQFNSSSDHWVDVTTFTTLLRDDPTRSPMTDPALDRLQQALALYRGNFLEGLSVGDSAAFEEWLVLNRERLHRLAGKTIRHLTHYYEQRGDDEAALQYAWQWVEVDPWHEDAHCGLMRLLTLTGQREVALTQYEICCQILRKEVGVEPGEATQRLYEQIRSGELGRLPPYAPSPWPSFLAVASPPVDPSPPVVARERELAQLDKFLETALGGQSQVVFVTGEAGQGKTALIQEFARQAQAVHSDLVVVGGNGNAHIGFGDPYLPFREILNLLTGEIETVWAAGGISQEQTLRLWQLLPATLQMLLEISPDLIDTLLPGPLLLQRTRQFFPTLTDLQSQLTARAEHQAHGQASTPLQPTALFEQYTLLLKALSRQKPLLLLLDDLQWADTASISLLFHLGRRLANSRILLVGAYRPAELTLGIDGSRHPLEPLVNEFKRQRGAIEIDLDQAAGRPFVETWLDLEPNRLGPSFRQTLYEQTRGHPLFTIELLRGMQARGDLIRDAQGQWLEGPVLDWETLPARVEAVIAERIGRLPAPFQEILAAASVEGEIFTAEVIAQVQSIPERTTSHWLSDTLGRDQRLVRVQDIRQIGRQTLSQYRFGHSLFQKYLYNRLTPSERVYLHEVVGVTLETLHGEQAAEIAVQLAYHFQAAGVNDKAIHYLQRAGERAVRLAAYTEAVTHYQQALLLLERLPDGPERLRQELELQMGLVIPLQGVKGYGDPEVAGICTRVWELCQQLEETPYVAPALLFLALHFGMRGDHQTGQAIGRQLLRLAESSGDPALISVAQGELGWNALFRGQLVEARSHLEQALAFFDFPQSDRLVFSYGFDPRGTSYAIASWTLCLLGYPEQALQEGRKGVDLAEALAHPWNLAFIQGHMAFLYALRRDVSTTYHWAEACVQLCLHHDFPFILTAGLFLRGWSLAGQEQFEAGLAEMWQSINERPPGNDMTLPAHYALAAEVYAVMGQPQAGLKLLANALSVTQQTGECFYEAEIHRLTGELLWQQGADAAEVEGHFQRAIEIARAQQAKLWELRATVSLCRRWQQQGKIAAARQILADIYSWFSEGFDTTDLQTAKALLAELSTPAEPKA